MQNIQSLYKLKQFKKLDRPFKIESYDLKSMYYVLSIQIRQCPNNIEHQHVVLINMLR